MHDLASYLMCEACGDQEAVMAENLGASHRKIIGGKEGFLGNAHQRLRIRLADA